MEPRNYSSRGAFVVPDTGAASLPRKGLRQRSCRGRRTGRRHTKGSLGTWEALTASRRFLSGRGDRTTNPRPAAVRLGPLGAKAQARRLVTPSEGNGARREGRRESHIPIVPGKQGNPYRGDPAEGRGMSVRDSWAGNPAGALDPGPGSTERPRIAQRPSEALAGRTGCLNWARPDLWEPWGVTPRCTTQVRKFLRVKGLWRDAKQSACQFLTYCLSGVTATPPELCGTTRVGTPG